MWNLNVYLRTALQSFGRAGACNVTHRQNRGWGGSLNRWGTIDFSAVESHEVTSVLCLSQVYFFLKYDSSKRLNYDETCWQLSQCNDYTTEWLILRYWNSVPVRSKSFFCSLQPYVKMAQRNISLYIEELEIGTDLFFSVWVLKVLYTSTSINSLTVNVRGYISYSTLICSVLLCPNVRSMYNVLLRSRLSWIQIALASQGL